MPARIHRSRRTPARQSGVAAVEFAVLVFLLLVIGAGLVEFGRAMWYYDALAKGTRDAARYLSTVPVSGLAGAVADDGLVKTIVVQAASAARVPSFTGLDVTIVCTPTPCASAGVATDVTRVTVSTTFSMTLGALFPFLAGDNASMAVSLAPHTTMPYMW